MADRSVKVTLRANVADFNAQIKSASKTLDQMVAAGDKTGKVADTAMGRWTQRSQLMGSQMTTAGTAVTAFGAGLLGVAAKAVTTAANFDQAMSKVQADTHETAANMSLLRDAAVQAGADTAFSASEAADGIDELAKAGVSTKDILSGGLTGALDLAAAGGVSVGEAAETAASAMTQFGLSGS
ncbi:TPA: phage tail tape measure protein, partial [Vibrio cholerae O1]